MSCFVKNCERHRLYDETIEKKTNKQNTPLTKNIIYILSSKHNTNIFKFLLLGSQKLNWPPSSDLDLLQPSLCPCCDGVWTRIISDRWLLMLELYPPYIGISSFATLCSSDLSTAVWAPRGICSWPCAWPRRHILSPPVPDQTSVQPQM